VLLRWGEFFYDHRFNLVSTEERKTVDSDTNTVDSRGIIDRIRNFFLPHIDRAEKLPSRWATSIEEANQALGDDKRWLFRYLLRMANRESQLVEEHEMSQIKEVLTSMVNSPPQGPQGVGLNQNLSQDETTPSLLHTLTADQISQEGSLAQLRIWFERVKFQAITSKFLEARQVRVALKTELDNLEEVQNSGEEGPVQNSGEEPHELAGWGSRLSMFFDFWPAEPIADSLAARQKSEQQQLEEDLTGCWSQMTGGTASSPTELFARVCSIERTKAVYVHNSITYN
jgi:hypothetical protein